jgi:hypothetical protein
MPEQVSVDTLIPSQLSQAAAERVRIITSKKPVVARS